MYAQQSHISQRYTPAYHTGALMLKKYRHSAKNDGWTVSRFSVYLQCYDEAPDWVADFTTQAEADAFMQQAQAEITLMRGHV